MKVTATGLRELKLDVVGDGSVEAAMLVDALAGFGKAGGTGRSALAPGASDMVIPDEICGALLERPCRRLQHQLAMGRVRFAERQS